jgi:hypothetical protein
VFGATDPFFGVYRSRSKIKKSVMGLNKIRNPFNLSDNYEKRYAGVLLVLHKQKGGNYSEKV